MLRSRLEENLSAVSFLLFTGKVFFSPPWSTWPECSNIPVYWEVSFLNVDLSSILPHNCFLLECVQMQMCVVFFCTSLQPNEVSGRNHLFPFCLFHASYYSVYYTVVHSVYSELWRGCRTEPRLVLCDFDCLRVISLAVAEPWSTRRWPFTNIIRPPQPNKPFRG